jgi:hypothetical protein
MITRFLTLSAIIMVMALALGCSSGQTDPVQNQVLSATSDSTFFPSVGDNQLDGKTIGYFTATFDLEKNEAIITQDRDPQAHINVTSYLPAPTIVVNGFDPSTGIVDIDFTIVNPYKINAYDPRVIIYTDSVGHMLMNADDWTGLFDIAGGLPINPFAAFVKDIPNRMFEQKASATVNMRILLPGGNRSVRFAIEVSYPTNCEEPYSIDNFQQTTLYDQSASTCSVGVDVFDWQSDAGSVYLYCPQITGGPLVPFTRTDPVHWTANLANNAGAIEGIYTGYIAAFSSGIALYDKVLITVTHFTSDCLIYVDDDNLSGPWDGSELHPYQYVQDAVNSAVDNCTIWIKPGTYNEDPGGTSDSGEAEVTVRNIQNLKFHGEGMPKIVLHPYYSYGRAGIHAYDSNGLTIEGIEFTPGHAYQSAVWLEDCDNAIVQDCMITPSPASGFLEFFRGEGCDGVTVQRNELDDIRSVSTYSHVFVLNSCTNALVTLNNCRRLIHGGYNINQTGMAYVGSYSSSDVEISKNIFGEVDRSADSDGYVQLRVFYISGGSNVTVRNNLAYDLAFNNTHQPTAPSNNWGVYASGSGNIQIYNNTFDQIGPSLAGTGSTFGIELAGCNNPTVYSNILTYLASNSSGECVGFKSDIACTIDYSDIWTLSGGMTSIYGGLASAGPGMIEDDPEYVDQMNYIYTLQTDSPCEGTGMNGDDMGCYGGADPLP